MVSHLTLQCFARGEEFMIGLMGRFCGKASQNPHSHIILSERWYEIDMRRMVPAQMAPFFMTRHLHFGLVCPKKKCVVMCSCAHFKMSNLFCLLKVDSREFYGLETLTWPCSDWDVYWGEFVSMSTSGKWEGKMPWIVSSWIIFLTTK